MFPSKLATAEVLNLSTPKDALKEVRVITPPIRPLFKNMINLDVDKKEV